MFTQLSNRILWYDGSIETNPETIMELLLKGHDISKLYTTEITQDIKEYNKLVPIEDKIVLKKELNPLDTSWNIPEEYKQININDYVIYKLQEEIKSCSLLQEDIVYRQTRIIDELKIYHKLNLNDLLKTLIYIIDIFNKNNIVWGVGRGSSVSSYVLYLIGVHDIDSVLYDLNFNDFLTG